VTIVPAASRRDADLTSIDTMMNLLLTGGVEEVNLTKQRFLELNCSVSGKSDTVSVSVSEDGHMLEEALNLAYSLRVLLSNTAGIKVILDTGIEAGAEAGVTLPLEKDENLGVILRNMLVAGSHGNRDGNIDEDEYEDTYSNSNRDKDKKKKKRKRGPGK